MNRNAFTLIELLVSIVLFGLITFFLFHAIDELRNQQTFFHKKQIHLEQKNKILSLMQSDFDRSQVSITPSASKDFDSASIIGSNRSLYGMNEPYVTWVVLKDENTLIRLESAYPITVPIRPESLYLTHSDVISKHCEIFRIYDSPTHRLIYLKIENQSPLMAEVMK